MVVLLTVPNGSDTNKLEMIRDAVARRRIFKFRNIHFITDPTILVFSTLMESDYTSWLQPDITFAVISGTQSTLTGALCLCRSVDLVIAVEQVAVVEHGEVSCKNIKHFINY